MLRITTIFAKAIIALMGFLVFGLLYIAPASMGLLYLGESRELYGLEASGYIAQSIAQSIWIFLPIYVWFAWTMLKGSSRPGRIVAVALIPMAIGAILLVPIGVLHFLRLLVLLVLEG